MQHFCFVVLEECHGTLEWLVAGKLLRITKSAESRVVLVWKSCASRSELPNLRGVRLSLENVSGSFQALAEGVLFTVGEERFSNHVHMDSWKTLKYRFSRCGQGPGSLHRHGLSLLFGRPHFRRDLEFSCPSV